MKFTSAAISIFLLAGSAWGQDVQGSAAGVWLNPAPATAVVTGVSTSSFTWGTSLAESPPSSLSFAAAGGGIAASFEQEFKVGSISYFNGTIVAGTQAASVDLRLILNFTSPALGDIVNDYTFNLINTNNVADPVASADFVQLPSSFGTSLFYISGTQYGLEILGFRNIVGDGFLTSNPLEFHVLELGSASADLYARVTSEVPPIPEPSTYALMLAGLAGVGFMARRRQFVGA